MSDHRSAISHSEFRLRSRSSGVHLRFSPPESDRSLGSFLSSQKWMNEFPKAWKTKEKVYRPSRVVTKKKYERRDGCHACMARANSPALPRVTKGRVCLMTHSPFFFPFRSYRATRSESGLCCFLG